MPRSFITFISKFLIKLSTIYWSLIYSNYRGKYKLLSSFKFNGKGIVFYGEGNIYIGECSYIGGISTIQSVSGATVTIGKNCQLSHNVRIYTQSLIANHDFSITPIPSYIKNVTVGDYCWIGANVFINPGVTIGSNSVIGANAVVTKDVPENAVMVGIPAKNVGTTTGEFKPYGITPSSDK